MPARGHRPTDESGGVGQVVEPHPQRHVPGLSGRTISAIPFQRAWIADEHLNLIVEQLAGNLLRRQFSASETSPFRAGKALTRHGLAHSRNQHVHELGIIFAGLPRPVLSRDLLEVRSRLPAGPLAVL
jgi:hypothetical protein